MSQPLGIAVLGATGSIGENTLDVIARHPQRFRAIALTAKSNTDKLFAQCQQHRPDYAAMVDATAAAELSQRIRKAGLPTQVLADETALEELAALDETDAVMAAVVGAAGLPSALAAVRAGKRVLLANKEALVMSGQLFMDAVAESGAELIPIDSEHNAIFQCLPALTADQPTRSTAGVRRIILTASGGPFRTTPLAELANITPAQACAHPNWVMGRKISVDSATMMNKGLEVIEACWLFGLPVSQVDVLVHAQSAVHSMVEYADGSVLAQLGQPDMRTPIAHALAWPERIESGVAGLNLAELAQLDFAEPDHARFPCLKLACQAIEMAGIAPTVLNAANEVAVAAFLDERLKFLHIPSVIKETLAKIDCTPAADDLAAVLAADALARQTAQQFVETL